MSTSPSQASVGELCRRPGRRFRSGSVGLVTGVCRTAGRRLVPVPAAGRAGPSPATGRRAPVTRRGAPAAGEVVTRRPGVPPGPPTSSTGRVGSSSRQSGLGRLGRLSRVTGNDRR